MKVKIIIPAEKKTMESPICLSLAEPLFSGDGYRKRCFEIIENKAEADSGGAGIKAAQLVLMQVQKQLLPTAWDRTL